MKFLSNSIINLGLLSSSALILASPAAKNHEMKTEMQVLGEVLGHVPDMEIVIELLKKLKSKADTLDDVKPATLVKKLVEVTGQPFSDKVYQYFGISDWAVKQLHSQINKVKASPRFGIDQTTMAAFDPSNYLLGYGCWCRFGGASKGRGKAVDDIDNLCKKLTQSYQCLRLDILNDDGAYCDPVTEPYLFDIGNYIMISLNLPSLTIADNCAQNNKGNKCAAQTCELELNMLMEYYRGLLKDPNFTTLTVDASKQHVKFSGPFDPAAECGNPGNPQQVLQQLSNQQINQANHAGNHPETWKSDLECCGTFPNRVPFHTLNGQRACCNGRTYNKIMNNCCAGTIQLAQC